MTPPDCPGEATNRELSHAEKVRHRNELAQRYHSLRAAAEQAEADARRLESELTEARLELKTAESLQKKAGEGRTRSTAVAHSGARVADAKAELRCVTQDLAQAQSLYLDLRGSATEAARTLQIFVADQMLGHRAATVGALVLVWQQAVLAIAGGALAALVSLADLLGSGPRWAGWALPSVLAALVLALGSFLPSLIFAFMDVRRMRRDPTSAADWLADAESLILGQRVLLTAGATLLAGFAWAGVVARIA